MAFSRDLIDDRLKAAVELDAGQDGLNCNEIFREACLPWKEAQPVRPDHLQDGKLSGAVVPQRPSEVLGVDRLRD